MSALCNVCFGEAIEGHLIVRVCHCIAFRAHSFCIQTERCSDCGFVYSVVRKESKFTTLRGFWLGSSMRSIYIWTSPLYGAAITILWFLAHTSKKDSIWSTIVMAFLFLLIYGSFIYLFRMVTTRQNYRYHGGYKTVQPID